MSETVHLALIGCGGMMGSHVEHGYQELWNKGIRTFRIVGCCDMDEDRARKMAAKVAAFQGEEPKICTDYRHVLDAPGVDAVDISVVHSEHHRVAVPLLQAGKHVTIEKPLAITMRAGRQIIEAAEKSGVVLQVAENYRRAPEMRAIRWAIRKGYLGRLRLLFWIDASERLWHWGWRDDVEAAGGGWSMDGGVHFADLFRFFIGEVEELYAVSRAYQPVRYRKPETLEDPVHATVEDTTLAVLKFENGVTGQWGSSQAAPGAGFSSRVIYGEHGSINLHEGLTTRNRKMSMEQLVQEYMASLSTEERERLFPKGITQPVATELKEFVDAVLAGGSIETDGWEGYRSEAVTLALYESSLLGAPVRLKDIEDLKIESYQERFNRLHAVV